MDPEKIDPQNPAYTVAYSVKIGDTYKIYVFTEDDELDDCDRIPLYTQDSLKNFFRGFKGLKNDSITSFLNQLDTSNVDTTINFFKECSGFTTLDVSSLDLSNVTNAASMFEKCTNLQTIIMGEVNFGKVTDFHQMFAEDSKLSNICSANGNNNDYEFNIQSSLILHWMFHNCSKLTDITLRGDKLTTDQLCVINPDNKYKNGKDDRLTCFEVFNGCSGLNQLTIKNIRFANLKNFTKIYNNASKTREINVDYEG